jgi:hypothetical protein
MALFHVAQTERTTEEGVPVTNIIAESTDGDPQTLELVTPPGVDALPLPGDVVVTTPGGSTGTEQAVGFLDPKNAGKAAEGEHRVYGRSPDGTVVNEFWLKGDGSIRGSNGAGWFEFGADGSFKTNSGFEVDPQGNVNAAGEVTARHGGAAVPVTQLMVPSPFGPLGPPIPVPGA